MAQQGGRRKKAPAYSADTMALRYIAGLALAALGVMIFMAVDLNMSGNIFQGLRQVCFGISGSLAYILAVLPLWAGGLVIWSAQRRAPVRPWVFALLSFIGICTFIMLISGNALDSLDRRSGGQFGNVLQNVYSDCMRTGTGGGVLGTLLGWPLWRFLGTILGVIIIFLGTLFCLLMAVNLTPSRLRDIFTGQYSAHREQQKQERMYAEQQQMAWQQQQYAQQQAWQQHLMEQQQQQQYAQQQNMQQPAAPQYPPQNMPQGMQAGQQSVAQWQDQMTAAQTAAAAPGHQSSIFGGRNTAQPEKPARNWKSRIFGKKEEEYDGLVGDDTVPAEPVQPPRKTTGRRTATGAEAAPVTEWNLPDREAEAARKRQAAQPAVTEPAEEAPEAKIPKSVNRDSYKRPADRRPVREEVEEPAPAPAEASDFITDLRKRGIDTDAGLKYCVGDKDFYKSLLIQFASEAADKIASMKKYHSLKDWHNYEILVHALKSTSKMIGIYDLSEKAKSLEMAAKNNDETYILGNHEAMIRDYDDITAVIREQLITGAPDDDGDVLEFAPEENGGDKV